MNKTHDFFSAFDGFTPIKVVEITGCKPPDYTLLPSILDPSMPLGPRIWEIPMDLPDPYTPDQEHTPDPEYTPAPEQEL